MDRPGPDPRDADRENPGLTLRALLAEAGELDPADRLALATHALERSSAWIYAHGESPVGAEGARRFRALVHRRRAGAPVAYLLGSRGFWTLDLTVNEATLIPRPESELLVELALEFVAPVRGRRILDLGTGSGAIALAIAVERRTAAITATDASAAALDVARTNAAAAGIDNVRFIAGWWFESVVGQRFDLVLSNPPYLAADDPHLDRGDLPAEPRTALVAGPTGLEDLEHIVAAAPAHLLPGGALILEHGHRQQDHVLAACRRAGLRDVRGHRDLAGIPRAVTARRPG